jgi:hypothetical protein
MTWSAKPDGLKVIGDGLLAIAEGQPGGMSVVEITGNQGHVRRIISTGFGRHRHVRRGRRQRLAGRKSGRPLLGRRRRGNQAVPPRGSSTESVTPAAATDAPVPSMAPGQPRAIERLRATPRRSALTHSASARHSTEATHGWSSEVTCSWTPSMAGHSSVVSQPMYVHRPPEQTSVAPHCESV